MRIETSTRTLYKFAMAYQWYGDMNPENGGAFYDLSVLEDGGDYVPCIKITDLNSAIGFDGAIMIEQGSIYIPPEIAKRKNALDVIGEGDNLSPTPLQLAEGFDAYGGMDRDIYNGLVTLQLQPDGDMSFDGWKADKRMTTGLKAYIESVYNVEF